MLNLVLPTRMYMVLAFIYIYIATETVDLSSIGLSSAQ